ncbi:MAG: alcohol dehydrogenase catalytic domain-containing protein [Proteobacteria bacterium]|nr:alcohol dehydrogenase catalytic domain-containing protein [Pseudomonadota bacterium]
MPRMRAVQVTQKGGPLELVERDMPDPGPGEVRVKVQACGVCHSDSIAVDGVLPSVPFPIVPGHEIAGVVDAIGAGVVGWTEGTRVGIGWFGGHCGRCDPCRRGYLIDCRNLRIPGVTYNGGYADAVVAPADALARMPDDLAPAEAAPLLCAGVTTYNALRESGARPGDVVAVLGIGGLGHLGVQFARKMGFRTVAIARGRDKEDLARQLGAHIYLDSQAQDVAAELTKLGGAKTILATVTSGKAMSAVIPGLAVRGRLVVVGVGMDPIEVAPFDLIGASRTIVGHASGASIDSEDALAFSALTGVRPMIETMPLERAAEAYDKMMRNEARFRMVLTMGS